jgi:SAM-dependent MidA family methyltransferase
MEIMLFDPQHGFYSSYLKIGSGKAHHFSTRPVDLSPHYGAALARKMGEYSSPEFTDLVALGDGYGVLFHDILSALDPALPGLRKTSIERVRRFCDEQRTRLERFGVRIINDSALAMGSRLPLFSGIVYSHELFDVFPASRVVQYDGNLQEVYITVDRTGFREVSGPLSNPALREYFDLTGSLPPAGQPCLVNLDALSLLKTAAGRLKPGSIFIIIDYDRNGGPLHSISDIRFGKRRSLTPENIPEAIGRDVTFDVDFEALSLISQRLGFQVIFNGSERELLEEYFPEALRTQLGFPMRALVLKK